MTVLKLSIKYVLFGGIQAQSSYGRVKDICTIFVDNLDK